MSTCRQEAEGFPGFVKRVFKKSGIALFRGMELLAAFPEYEALLPGGVLASDKFPDK